MAHTFKLAIGQLNLLKPEFVITVGDLIEGYSDDKAELNAEWDEMDAMLSELKMPFFRTPGNHDIANETAQALWRERYGATYYDFVYKNVLFVVLDSEDYCPVHFAMMEQTKLAFDRNDITIPFPQRDVHMKAAAVA